MAASDAFNKFRRNALSPEENKVLREWGISDTASMVNRTPQTIRNLEESGKIPKARLVKKGKREERVYNLQEINHIRDVLGVRLSKPEGIPPAIISFANFKGGAGKTTTAINAAQYFAKQGYKTLVIDCDCQASLTQMFGYVPDESFEENETLLNILTSDDLDIRKIIKRTYWDGLDLIPANLGLYNAELIIPTIIRDHAINSGEEFPFYNMLNRSLRGVYDDYDIIINDCPPSMGMISINAIYAANAIVVEMPPSTVDYASTKQFFKMVGEIMDRLPTKHYAFIRLLITKYSKKASAETMKDTLKTCFGQYLMSNYMMESEAIHKAGSDLKTLYEVDKFIGDKRTFDRAIQSANLVNEELESLIKLVWEKSIAQKTLVEGRDV